ncbi:14569_t:CDS:1 [Funneliformis geosporum]|uniref:E3 ubiquitin-protein ligase CHIP n=1 Tax=Funneliformis geosporum TaxID=1117311 RepID=A0A9W4WP08_9GLOM|nr:14569_t:CDS:1 [Funneliformis geosporum]CAI2168091.1 13114_t:CDS:1 [Funneliformis geosporum]
MSNSVERAESHKTKGNTQFSKKDYDSAVREYSAAIAQNPRNAVYYTNRALCYLKLKKYDNVILDCENAISIDANSVKGHYMIGQALTEKADFDLAISHLQKAYDYAIIDKVAFSGDIIQALLKARKKKWEFENQRRQKSESESLKYVKGLINAEREKQLQKVTQSKNSIGSTFSKFVNSHSMEIQDKINQVNLAHDERLSQVEQVFAQAEENQRQGEIPEYFLDKISFNVMHDPVITPSGITYERIHLKEHFKKIGYFDPLSRRECRENDLYPNLALKEAIEDYLNKNGWAADY